MVQMELPRVSRRGGSEVCAEAERMLNESGRRETTLYAIFDALRDGPKTNMELTEITPRYSARIYDLRAIGVPVVTERPRLDGLVTYRIATEVLQ